MLTLEDANTICTCSTCDSEKCCWRNKFQRLPRAYFPGALERCPRWIKAKAQDAEKFKEGR